MEQGRCGEEIRGVKAWGRAEVASTGIQSSEDSETGRQGDPGTKRRFILLGQKKVTGHDSIKNKDCASSGCCWGNADLAKKKITKITQISTTIALHPIIIIAAMP